MRTALWAALGAGASGLLFCLALPPADMWWLGWFAFVPLLVAVRGRGFLYGFLGGLLALLVCAAAVRSGVFYSDQDQSGSSAWIDTGCGLFGFVIAMSAGIWADRGTAKKPAIWFAAIGVSLEAVLLVKLPAHLALTQYRQPAMLYLASVGGIWLVSLLAWLANFWVAKLVLDRRYRWLPVLPVVLLTIAFIQRWPQPTGGLAVAAVQTEAVDEKTLTRLQMEASIEGTSLAVWPEFSGLVMAPRGRTEALEKLATTPGSASFVTSFEDDFSPLPHNVSAVFSPSGVSKLYYKRHLLGGEANMHTAGTQAVASTTPFGGVGLAICYDSCFPASIRETAGLDGVRVITLPAVDPASPHHFVAAIHAAFTPFRAAENGIPIVRADGYGHSMIVDGDGQILSELGGGEGIARAAVSPPHMTLYRYAGDVVLYAAIALGLAGFFLFRTPRPGRS